MITLHALYYFIGGRGVRASAAPPGKSFRFVPIEEGPEVPNRMFDPIEEGPGAPNRIFDPIEEDLRVASQPLVGMASPKL